MGLKYYVIPLSDHQAALGDAGKRKPPPCEVYARYLRIAEYEAYTRRFDRPSEHSPCAAVLNRKRPVAPRVGMPISDKAVLPIGVLPGGEHLLGMRVIRPTKT